MVQQYILRVTCKILNILLNDLIEQLGHFTKKLTLL